MILARLLLVFKCISALRNHPISHRQWPSVGQTNLAIHTITPVRTQAPRGVILSSRKEDVTEIMEDENPELFRFEDAEDIDGSIFEDMETGKPPEWLIMKELLGINIFTYILGGLILLFLSLNLALGPGWLGQAIGIEGTGSITEVSDAFPDTVDLNSPEFKLDL